MRIHADLDPGQVLKSQNAEFFIESSAEDPDPYIFGHPDL
jgi:hypothetical protein